MAVDLAGAHGLVEVLGRADALAQVDRVAVGRQRLPPQLAEQARLGEVLRAERDAQLGALRLRRPALIGLVVAAGADRERQQEHYRASHDAPFVGVSGCRAAGSGTCAG